MLLAAALLNTLPINVLAEDVREEYTVTFVNAAGETVSTEEYEEGTKASAIIVPANTANDSTHSYSWPTIGNVTRAVTYNEIETVLAETQIEIGEVSINGNNFGNNTSNSGSNPNSSIFPFNLF
ncbi:MAG: hypothetical protein IJ746_02855 [Ruminococcus sp.]|nr:hypothetical protein [Ruminococcus sp.]